MSEDNYIIIDDYFICKQEIKNLEERNKDLEQKLKNLEQIINKHLIHQNKKNMFIKVVDTYNTAWTYYERMKVISVVVIFFFGNKILSDPYCLKYAYDILKNIFS